MIVKRGMQIPGLKRYSRRNRHVMAVQMKTDFMYETGNGWISGKRGEWLVLVGGDLWTGIEDKQFKTIFSPATEKPCEGCDATTT